MGGIFPIYCAGFWGRGKQNFCEVTLGKRDLYLRDCPVWLPSPLGGEGLMRRLSTAPVHQSQTAPFLAMNHVALFYGFNTASVITSPVSMSCLK
jgi:hypothetical protein